MSLKFTGKAVKIYSNTLNTDYIVKNGLESGVSNVC